MKRATATTAGQLSGGTSDVCCVGRAPTEDEQRGIAWWNGLSEAKRQRWLDIAWRRNERAVAGGHRYSLDDLPSAADAWAAYKETLSLCAPGCAR